MGRPGELYDQDAQAPLDSPWGPPVHAGRGMLYDQDASVEMPRIDPLIAARLRREEDRRRDREMELLRQRRADELRARAERSRPGPAPAQVASRPAPVVEPPDRADQGPGPGRPDPGRPDPGRPGPGRPDAGRPPRLAPAPDAAPDAAPGLHAAPQPRSIQADRAAVRGAGQAPPAAGRASAPSTGRATAVLAFGTFASRLTGFVRVLVIGYVLGVGALSDAFNYANGVPNIVYDLLLGGILSATLIPVFVEHLADDDAFSGPDPLGDPQAGAAAGPYDYRRRTARDASHSISAILTAISLTLLVVTALLWVAAPAVIHFYLLLNTASTGPAERALATRLLRYFAPQVFFLGTIVATTALLNARRRFTAAAVSPVINNLIAIAALLATKVVATDVLTARGQSQSQTLDAFGRDSRAVLVLGVGTTIGYAVQLIVQLPALHRLGLRLRPVLDLRHPAVRRVAGLSTWLLGVVVANQVSLALVFVLAGRRAGWLTAYQFSYQFFQLPYALIAVSVASAIMPDLAERWSNRQRVEFERQFVTGLRVTLAVLIPVALIYMVLSQPLIDLALHHGRVTQSGAHLISSTLVLFLAGLPGFAAFFLLMRVYQAMQDARTMFRIYVLENALTIVAAFALAPVLGVGGLALAWVGPYTVASIYAVAKLRHRVGNLGGWLTIRALFRIVVASAVATAAVVAVGLPFPAHASDPVLIVRLLVQGGVGAAVYLYLARVLHIREMRPVMAMAGRVLRR